jgi:hypothetical protein
MNIYIKTLAVFAIVNFILAVTVLGVMFAAALGGADIMGDPLLERGGATLNDLIGE